jgi:hypothetical protein
MLGMCYVACNTCQILQAVPFGVALSLNGVPKTKMYICFAASAAFSAAEFLMQIRVDSVLR